MAQFDLKAISVKRFLISAFVGAIFTISTSVSLGVILNSGLITVVLLLVLMAITIYAAHKIAIIDAHIVLNGTSIILDNRIISFNSIVGYFLNETGLTMTAFTIKLDTNENVSLTTLNFGSQKQPFRDFTSELTTLLKAENINIKELSFQEVYVKQVKWLRRYTYVLIPMVILLNLFMIYLFFFTDAQLKWWKLLVVNSSLLALLPYIKKKKSV